MANRVSNNFLANASAFWLWFLLFLLVLVLVGLDVVLRCVSIEIPFSLASMARRVSSNARAVASAFLATSIKSWIVVSDGVSSTMPLVMEYSCSCSVVSTSISDSLSSSSSSNGDFSTVVVVVVVLSGEDGGDSISSSNGKTIARRWASLTRSNTFSTCSWALVRSNAAMTGIVLSGCCPDCIFCWELVRDIRFSESMGKLFLDVDGSILMTT
mmetsp:Transcript_2606/g.4058  ORF Transcript_2606/g.4058 Transcript_2606/m.4058 type:complete len:213 (-) Transcript_2606:1068-1706(-)